MIQEPKKLGELLVEARLISPAQLQEALRYQRIAGGRMGSNLVTLGFITEDVLMDFLSQQTGVPRVDLRHVDIPPQVLERIPRRLAEQLNVLPVSLKEPKSLVLAMADPSDLNAVDSARFASGMNIEPMVASYSALKAAIPEQYRKLEILSGRTVEIGGANPREDGLALPVPLEFNPGSDPRSTFPGLPLPGLHPHPPKEFPKDPFFDNAPTLPPSPISFLSDTVPDPFQVSTPPPTPLPPAQPLPTDSQGMVIFDRASRAPRLPKLENLKTRTLILGLIRLLQRRGVLSEEELTRLIQTLLDTREIKEEGDRE